MYNYIGPLSKCTLSGHTHMSLTVRRTQLNCTITRPHTIMMPTYNRKVKGELATTTLSLVSSSVGRAKLSAASDSRYVAS